jgi:hypothetical protein
MKQILKLPPLPNGPKSNIAGVLPLSGLLEFVDVVTKLHLYELLGRGSAWNWPVTVVGARVLLERARLENEHNTQACLLDTGEVIPPLLSRCRRNAGSELSNISFYMPSPFCGFPVCIAPDSYKLRMACAFVGL